MELRNIQEQVAKNQEDIKTLKSGIRPKYAIDFSELASIITDANVGEYAIVNQDGENHLYIIARRANNGLIAKNLGEYPAVVQGQKGDKGDDGSNGERGSTIYGVSINPPSDAKVGDFYIQKKIVDGATDYVLNKLDGSRTWRPQFSMRGPQGLPGISEEIVIANPEDLATESLTKLDVHGVVYSIGADDGYEYLTVDKSTGNVSDPTANKLVFYDYGNIEFWGTVISIDELNLIKDENGVPYFSPYIQRLKDLTEEDFTVLEYISKQFIAYYYDYYLGLNTSLIMVNYATLHITDNTYLKDLDGNNLLEIEAFKDSEGHNRFIEGSISVTTQEGLTVRYGKWSLSGTHFICVISGETEAETYPVISLRTTFNNLPQWVFNKIYAYGGDNVTYSNIYVYDKVTTSVNAISAIMIKTDTKLNIYHSGNLGSANGTLFRVQFDLLVDND